MSSHVLRRRSPAHARRRPTSQRVMLGLLIAAILVSATGLVLALLDATKKDSPNTTPQTDVTSTSLIAPTTETAPAVVEDQSSTTVTSPATTSRPHSTTQTTTRSSGRSSTTDVSILVGDGTITTTTTTAQPTKPSVTLP